MNPRLEAGRPPFPWSRPAAHSARARSAGVVRGAIFAALIAISPCPRFLTTPRWLHGGHPTLRLKGRRRVGCSG